MRHRKVREWMKSVFPREWMKEHPQEGPCENPLRWMREILQEDLLQKGINSIPSMVMHSRITDAEPAEILRWHLYNLEWEEGNKELALRILIPQKELREQIKRLCHETTF